MVNKQPEALRLADALENDLVGYDGMSIPRIGQNIADEAAAELRRLYEENVQMGEQRLQRLQQLVALHLALEYWAHREQRYKNRSPAWVQKSRAAIAKAGGAA